MLRKVMGWVLCGSRPEVQDDDTAPYVCTSNDADVVVGHLSSKALRKADASALSSRKDNGLTYGTFNHDGEIRGGPVNDQMSQADSSTDDCAICMCPPTQPKKLPCGHSFCTDCIRQAFAKCQPKCPTCGYICGMLTGNQPGGQMTTQILQTSLAGYEQHSTIKITYDIPDGIQDDTHPRPGVPFYGARRTAYLPNNDDGQEVCRLLQRAFDARLVFTVGRSITTGLDNTVVWNDIHHKTRPTGPYGYPDATYLQRVRDELAAKGISSSQHQHRHHRAADTHSPAAATADDIKASRRASSPDRCRRSPDNTGPPTSSRYLAASNSEFRGEQAARRSPRKLKQHEAAEDNIAKDQIGVEEFLWRYIEKYHKGDLAKMCGPDVKCTYDGAASTPLLVFESSSGTSVRDASERVACLCQKLVNDITETTFPYPEGANRVAFMELGTRLADSARAVFYVDRGRVCHVVGLKDRVTSVERQLLGATSKDDAVGQTPRKRTSSSSSEFTMTTDGGVRVRIYAGNLVEEAVDAVVNPANVRLSHGGGAARAIADAAGSQLRRECRDYIHRYGQLKFTQVMHTTAGNMNPPVQYVIHAAGPPADQYRGNPDALRQAVFDTFFNCLRYANEHLRVSSVSIPAISSGIFGVSKDVVAAGAYDALMKFDQQHLQLAMRRNLQRVNYVNIDADTTAVFIQTFSSARSTPDDRGRDTRGAAATVGGGARGIRRSKTAAERPPAKRAIYLQSKRHSVDVGRHGDDCVNRPASSAVQPHNHSSEPYVILQSRL